MREIKFRGKVLEGGWMYVTPESSSWEQFWALVDKKTLGEFTGCYDGTLWERATPEEQKRWLKHHARDEWKGVEIYEGDVVKGQFSFRREFIEEIREVKYDNQMLLMPFHEIVGYDEELWMDKATCQIIGNVYDNPDLKEQ